MQCLCPKHNSVCILCEDEIIYISSMSEHRPEADEIDYYHSVDDLNLASSL